MVFERHEYRSAIRLLLDALLKVHDYEVEWEGVRCSPSVDVLITRTLMGMRADDDLFAGPFRSIRFRNTLREVRSWLKDLGVSPQVFDTLSYPELGDAPAKAAYRVAEQRGSCRRCAEYKALLPESPTDEDRRKVDAFLGAMPHASDCTSAPVMPYKLASFDWLCLDGNSTVPEKGGP